MDQGGSFGWYPSLVLTPVMESLTEFSAAKPISSLYKYRHKSYTFCVATLHSCVQLQNKTAEKSGFIQ